MPTCTHPGCTAALTYPGRGRPPLYCPEHRHARKLARDRRRHRANSVARISRLPPCCQSWAIPGTKRRTCKQHRQWHEMYHGVKVVRQADLDLLAQMQPERDENDENEDVNPGFRVSRDPDSFWASAPGEWHASREATAWLAAHNLSDAHSPSP